MAFRYAVALTGGIGTGKSTSSALFKLYGFRVIDADKIAHTVLDASHSEIANIFGKEYIDSENRVIRSKLGKLIFSNREAKARLEKLLHPKIFREIEKESEKLDKFQFPYLIDIPLFFETANYPIEKSIVVYAPKEQQIERIMKRNNFTREEAIKRIEAQMDIEEKKRLATYLIDNSRDLPHLQTEVERVAKLLEGLFS